MLEWLISLAIIGGLFLVAIVAVEGYFKVREWWARRSQDTLTVRWWKEREHLGQRVEHHGPVIKFPIRKQ